MAVLKEVYKTVNEEQALKALESLEETWEREVLYSDSVRVLITGVIFGNLSTYFAFPPEIRRIIYTTNSLEGFNRQLRKFLIPH